MEPAEGDNVQNSKGKEKKSKKDKKKKGKALKVITSSKLATLESIQIVVESQSESLVKNTDSKIEGPQSSAKVLSTKSQSDSRTGRSKSKVLRGKSSTITRSKKFASETSQDDESYSSGSTASEEEKTALSKIHLKRKRAGKGKTVRLPAEKDGADTNLDNEEIQKEKKDKKGKGKKRNKKERKSSSPEKDAEDEMLEQLMKLKLEATGAGKAESIAETELSKKSKKKEKKKGSSKKKKDKKITPQMAEQLRMEAEQEAIRQAELEKIRLAEERLLAIEKEKKDAIETQVREEQLTKTLNNIKKALDFYTEAIKEEQEEEEWRLYLECRKLPNPYFCSQINTYLHIWKEEIQDTDVSKMSERTKNTLQLIEDLEELIATLQNPKEHQEKLKNWLWIRQLLRNYQQTSVDVATYRLLRNVYKNLVRIDIPTADFNYKDSFVTICIWLRVQLPKPLPNPRRPPKPRIDVTFKQLDDLQIILPLSMNLEKLALRAMYLKYDHLSDICEFFYIPSIPAHYYLDLKQCCRHEWRLKLKYKYANRDKKPRPVFDADDEAAAAYVSEPEDFASDEEIPVVPYKKLDMSASDYCLKLEEKDYRDARTHFTKFASELPTHVINLRKFVILGGVSHINLLHQPPQPQDYVILDLNITRLFVPKELEHAHFYVSYQPPLPSDPDVRKPPEELEEEMKRNEEALDSLISINLTWPKHVIFLELPFVCVWDKEKYWTNRNVHDMKHNEEKGTVSFRSQIFGVFGLATLRYANLPYQAWEIKPEANGSVNISITSAILIFEFNIQDGKICLMWVQNSPNNALKPYIGKYMKLYSLIKIFKDTGIDIFPEHDAFSYVEGSCEKHWPMEKNLYCNMASLSGCFNFAWSRWNLSLGRRAIVLLMREFVFDKSKQKNYSTLLVTPLKATIINCTEVSQEFSDEPAEAIKFCADLYNLMKAISGISLRKKAGEFSKLNIYTMSQFLIATRVLSFS